MKIYILPIEPFEERYTAQWYEHWPRILSDEGFGIKIIDGEPIGDRVGGEFLSPVDTWIWKSEQLRRLASIWNAIDDGDWILSLDGWGPATTAVAYIRDTTNKPIRLAVFMHAGSYDPHDFLARSNMRRWALDVERGWLKAADLIFVGSQFHKDMIESNLGLTSLPIVVTGNPIFKEELGIPLQWDDRDLLVVFPHRLAPEKAPSEFDVIKTLHSYLYPDTHRHTRWIRTYDNYTNKKDYYNILRGARCVVSTAYQETFGIAMQEGIALGAWAVCPNRCSYPYVLRGGGLLYNSLEEAARLVQEALTKTEAASWDGYHEHAIERAAKAIKEYES